MDKQKPQVRYRDTWKWNGNEIKLPVKSLKVREKRNKKIHTFKSKLIKIRNDDGMLAVSDENQKTAWKSYHEKLLNTYFACNKNSQSR